MCVNIYIATKSRNNFLSIKIFIYEHDKLILWFVFVHSESREHWFALYKTAEEKNAPTYWLDGNPSGYRWWRDGYPDEDDRCVLYTPRGFKDNDCSDDKRFTCKMTASKQQPVSIHCLSFISVSYTHLTLPTKRIV